MTDAAEVLTEATALAFRGVLTTGVYCRATCISRPPRPENMRWFGCVSDAQRAGFRPCLRCRPNDEEFARRNADLVAEAYRLIDAGNSSPTVAALAHALGISEGHFHRTFRAHTGMTPRAYMQEKRAALLREGLRPGKSVTSTFYEAGYGSSGRFYAVSNKALGMAPSDYQAGGRRERIRFAVGQTSLGSIVVASSDKGVVAILLGDDPNALLVDLQERFANAILVGGDTEYEEVVARVVGMVEAPQVGVSLPLDLRGTAFQRRVWLALREIPPGKTVRYEELARRIGSRKRGKAVASACASNPLAVAIPCHRVTRSDGSAFRYTWGIDRKCELLRRERVGIADR
ncbi:bifunctional DNA-binding transcriptional regulator/O6-methylguanine-DNA methyltransferase Ada [Agrobacterium pusense]|uniref:bifunctional DNA-binding transcriptional regulator/O6-methylguanine-DNA methyltransferase Ada n=1 Tax=Agrobacterium pusense TaxID=648995 RepID=UPI0008826F97|nr:bifunctional DNA-binding transcriptional regulator/O6-methylguanine-DNA methyltransferase Ada [Agrobacterium pusense]OOO22926.1 bifunctional transcriptional activator/DNA repair enzyme protein Ada [Agrobacterium pusense]WKD48104.1 bifunctional DNA-binding transcriptional regulator/O6-methylguanine-DNA methyltransferase Ada [Agrobacterium pusense]SDF60057.1 AraC family transcriptional regulator, regulatory protein of adaptative response / methylated-DNA-[protein]-cysteine methyltransferase [Ag